MVVVDNISYTDFLFYNRHIIIREEYEADRIVKRMIESGIIDPAMIDNYEEHCCQYTKR